MSEETEREMRSHGTAAEEGGAWRRAWRACSICARVVSLIGMGSPVSKSLGRSGSQGIVIRSWTLNNILLVALSLAFSVVIIEGFLMWRPEFQALVPFPNRVFCAGPPQAGWPHETFGWTAPPNSAYFEQTSEADGWAVHIYNAGGFRDLFDSGNEHVIVLGDSFTQGADASNDEAFPYLLDLWNPELSFHNFGTAAYGTKNSLSVYEAISSKIPHDLVILAYFLGNDLRDNLSSRDKNVRSVSRNETESSTWRATVKQINSTIRQNLRTYNLLYTFVRSAFGGFDLSRERIEKGVEITSSLLTELAAQIRANGSDFLIVILPSWNQMKSYRDPEEAAQQRAMINELAAEWDNIYVIDIADIIAGVGVDKFYGVKDKHFSRYGYYATAKTIHEWINSEWPGGHRAGRQAPPFQPASAPVVPDCALMPKYRETFTNPSRPGMREGPGLVEAGSPAGQARSGSPDIDAVTPRQ
jgi:GDSL-like Lipase/Acylhydrolase family